MERLVRTLEISPRWDMNAASKPRNDLYRFGKRYSICEASETSRTMAYQDYGAMEGTLKIFRKIKSRVSEEIRPPSRPMVCNEKTQLLATPYDHLERPVKMLETSPRWNTNTAWRSRKDRYRSESFHSRSSIYETYKVSCSMACQDYGRMERIS